MADKQKINEILDILSDLQDPDINSSPFAIANSVSLSLDDLLNTIMDNETLKEKYTVYLAGYKSKLLNWSLENKVYTITSELLLEAQVIKPEGASNDLELTFNIPEDIIKRIKEEDSND